MKLPEKLTAAFAAGYREFSWVECLSRPKSPALDLFAKGQTTYQGHRFYWQTPTHDLFLVGVGKSALTLGPNQSDTIYTNSDATGTGPLWCGGLAFNHDHPAPDIWGELDQGLFFIPRLLLTLNQSETYLTLNFHAKTLAELEANWRSLHLEVTNWLQAPMPVNTQQEPLLTTEELAVNEWLDLVEQTVTTLKNATDLKKVVLARQLKVTSTTPWQSYQILRNLQRQQLNTYVFALEAGDHLFMGATPERLLHATQTSYTTACIAGSIARGQTEEEDAQLGNALLADIKNQEEHQIVVDQIATDLRSLIEDDLIPLEPTLLKNRDIQHLHVPLTGTRKTGRSFLTGVKLLHPTPALGGQPKQLACDYIADHEPIGRGMYGAPIGWLDPQTDCGEFAVGIRSGVFTEKKAYLYAGCGIVTDSVAALEREETKIKFQPMLRAIGGMNHVTSKNND